MKKSLHLHVGLPKCGSSSLQMFLRSKAAELEEVGFVYPDKPGWPLPNLRSYLYGITGKPGTPVFRHYSPDASPATAVEDLWAAVDRSDAPNVVLSAEELFRHRDASLLDGITDRFARTHVHIVLRPWVDWIMSNYAQGVKTGRYNLPLDRFLQSRQFRDRVLPSLAYARHVAFWQGRHGRENVSVHFAAKGFPSVVNQFLAAAGLDLREPEDELRRNQSPSAFLLSAYMAVDPGEQEEFLKLRTDVQRLAQKWDPQPKAGFLTREIEAQITASLAEDLDALLSLQNRITAADLFPDNSDKHATAVRFEDVVSSAAFASFTEEARLAGLTLQAV